MQWLVNRGKEGSTWAGVGVILQGLGALFPAQSALLQGLTMVVGGLAVMTKSKGASDDVKP